MIALDYVHSLYITHVPLSYSFIKLKIFAAENVYESL